MAFLAGYTPPANPTAIAAAMEIMNPAAVMVKGSSKASKIMIQPAKPATTPAREPVNEMKLDSSKN